MDSLKIYLALGFTLALSILLNLHHYKAKIWAQQLYKIAGGEEKSQLETAGSGKHINYTTKTIIAVSKSHGEEIQ